MEQAKEVIPIVRTRRLRGGLGPLCGPIAFDSRVAAFAAIGPLERKKAGARAPA